MEGFVRLYDQGLIYRANRLCNWSCKLQTGISDLEVEFLDLEKPTEIVVPGHKEKITFGTLTYFAYPIIGSSERIIVATTRLETMLGDTAVAVNSKDPRYTHLIGKSLLHPIIKDRKIKIIADDILVDMKFGTGAVKVTPAHDPNDFDCGIRNKLEFINIFTSDGKINENGGVYKGLMRFDCRKLLFEDLQKLGLIIKVEPNKMRLGMCQRLITLEDVMIKKLLGVEIL